METHHTTRKHTDKKKNINMLGVGLALLLAAAAFFSGLQFGQVHATSSQMQAGLFSSFFSRYVTDDTQEKTDLKEFWRVWNLLDEKFVTSSSSQALTKEQKIQGAIKGLVESYGDPYTVFFPPSDAKEFDTNLSGNFSGVGMEVGIRDSLLTVIAPLPDTPAFDAGIVSGDVIVRINGSSTESMNLDKAVKKIRGEKGTVVNLTIFREGEDEFLEIPVTRDTITIPTIKTEQKDDVFIISLYSFNALSEEKMKTSLQEYVKSGADKLILDLRGNPGGFLQSAVSIGSYFIPAGEIIVRENFGDGSPEDIYRSRGKTLGRYTPKQMVVLVDGGSASAAEILAGALSEHKAATLIGQRTFGKGSVQELIDLPDGSSLKVTIARWFTPEGVSISEHGLDPDIVVERTPQQIIAGEDPQRDAAIQFLHGDTELTAYRATTSSSSNLFGF